MLWQQKRTFLIRRRKKKKPQMQQTKHSVKGIFCPYLDLKTAGEKPSLSDFVEIFV